ncbi:MAG: M50 family metallopeptidase [Trueperaceae bacterium]|nr:M50 family metallopeptidase [Trueperaceae bacterium]
MFQNSYRLPFNLLGIPVKLDLSFLLILPLLAWIIGSQVGAYVELLGLDVQAGGLEQGNTPYILGLVAAIGLFISVVIHELGHAVTAKRYGVETKAITLWFLGGLAQFDEMPRQRGAEAIVAIAGPITSFILAGLFYLLWSATSAPAVVFVFSYLTVTNAALAIFNMLPALPLDGGRVLRSLLALRLNYLRATQISSNVSQILAVLLGVFGLLNFNIFLMAIAFFIYSAVRGEARYAMVSQVLADISVRDIMTRDVITVPPDMPVSQLMKLMFYRKHLGYPVVDDTGTLRGFVKLQNAKDVDEDTIVEKIMSRQPNTISPDADALEAFKRINQDDIGRLVVTDEQGDMVGILSKTDLVRVIQIQAASDRQEPPERPEQAPQG